MTRLRILAACALLALGACKDSTGSQPKEPELTVQVTATASPPTFREDADGAQQIECSITFDATVAGDATVKGRWTGGVLRFFVGTSTSAADSLVMTDYEMSQAFGGDFAAGEHRTAGLGLLAYAPYALEIEMRYRVNGVDAPQPARARTTCGVPVGQPGILPVVSGVNVVPPAGGPEPGDTVRVSWTASGSPWLWETGVEVIGSFTAFRGVPGNGRGAITHSVDIVIPTTAVLGQPFQVRVYAADVWLRTTTSPVWASLPVMDRTPPRVFSVTTSRLRHQPSLAGQYGVGDSMKVYATVGDNHGVTYMVYEFAPMGVRDSVAVAGPGGTDAISIPLGPSLAGATGFRLWFRDASGNRTPDVVAASGAVRVYPVRDVAVRSVQVPGPPKDIVVDPARNRMYALIENTKQLRIHSLPGLELVRTVTLPSVYTALDLTADGDSLLISSHLTRSLVVMDVNATDAPAAFTPQGVSHMYGIRIASTGRAIALARMTDGRTAVLEVDMAAGTRRVIAPSVTVPEPLAGVARSRDRRKIVLGAGCVFDVQTEQVGVCRTMSHDGRSGPLSGGATGDAWGRMYELFDAGLQSVWSLDAHDAGLDAVPLTGGIAYVAGHRGVLRVRADGTIAERFTSTPLGTLRLSDDGTLLAGATAAQGVFRIGVVDPR